jgi:ribosomal-protein-alanine N-acetyltransferase
VERVVVYGFREMKLNRIEATVDPENVRSVRLLETCGFIREGLLRRRYHSKDDFHDELVCAFLHGDWEKQNDL